MLRLNPSVKAFALPTNITVGTDKGNEGSGGVADYEERPGPGPAIECDPKVGGRIVSFANVTLRLESSMAL